MKNKKEKQNSSNVITWSSITDITTSIDTSCIFTSTDSIDFSIDTTSNCIVTYDTNSSSSLFIYNDPYQELEETKQQQEKEEELRKENSCLKEAWNEYQLILKLLEENECDKFVEKRYGMKK